MILNGAIPPFDLQGGMALALTRAAWLAALFSAAGTLAVRALVAPAALARAPDEAGAIAARRLRILARGSLLAAIAAGAAWLLVQAATMSDADSLADLTQAIPVVAGETRFGQLLLLQLAAAAASIGLVSFSEARWRTAGAAGCAGLAVLLQAEHGHAAAMAGAAAGPLLLADAVHVVSAALWLGGLVPLLLLVRELPPRAAVAAARGFASLGRLCVLGLVGSAAMQAWMLIGTLPGLFGTAYGWVALVKFALLGVLLGFAASNRYRLAPGLLREDPMWARLHLVRSIAVQTGFGMVVVAAAAVLSGLQPAIHLQPVWPFAVQPSLAAIREDPDFRREVIGAALAVLAAASLLGLAVGLRRRWSLPLGVAALGIAGLAFPHFDLLLAEAGPTTYVRSPTGFAAASILRGVELYPAHCASCHGADGRGDGPGAAESTVPPADLTAAHLWMHDDGEMFGWLSSGIANPGGPGLAMPGFASVLSEDDRWALIDAIRARNAGLTRAATGAWSPPLPAPAFEARCGGSGQTSLADLRGQVVRLAIGVVPADLPGIVTVIAGADIPDSPRRCVTADPAVAVAYALATGIPADRIAGTQILIDANGWLRDIQLSNEDPAGLALIVDRLRQTPLATPGGAPPMAM